MIKDELRIDSHQHFWFYDPSMKWIDETMHRIRRDFLPDDLEPTLRQNAVDGCIAVQSTNIEIETEFLLDLSYDHDFIYGVVGWVDLLGKDLEEKLDFYALNHKFKGVRHVAQSEPDDFLSRKDIQAGISKLTEFNLTYDILIYEKQLPAAIELVKALPDQPFVIDHIAKPLIRGREIEPWGKMIKELASYENVMCKVSGLVTEADWTSWSLADFEPYLDIVFETFGIERVMYGSDWPVCLLGGEYTEVKNLLANYMKSLSIEEKDKVWGGNAVKFYNI